MLKITAYTDGSCLGNPGVGGYAAKMMAKGKTKYCSGYEVSKTTNNRMELRAVIEVVDWCNNVQKEPCNIDIWTDSQYIMNLSKQPRSSLTSESRKNYDLWMELIQKGLKGGHHITFFKVKAHSGDTNNKEVDELARAQAKKARHKVFGEAE